MNQTNCTAPESEKRKKRSDTLLILSGWLIITLGGLGRYTYSTLMSEIIADKGFLNAEAGLVSTCLFFSYGITQFLLVRRFRSFPIRIPLAVGILVSALINFLMPFCSSLQMAGLSVLNGISTALTYMIVVEVFACFLSPERMATGSMFVGTALPATKFLLFGMASVSTSFFNWHWTFYVSGALMTAVAVYWIVYARRFPKHLPPRDVPDNSAPGAGMRKKAFLVVLLINTVGGVAFGFIRRVIDAWLPVILKNDFHVGQSVIYVLMIGVVGLTMLASFLTRLVTKWSDNYSLLQCYFYFAVALISGAIVGWITESSVVLFVVAAFLTVLLSSCISSLSILFLPIQCREYVATGSLFSILNAASCAGICIADYGVGSALDRYPWQTVFGIVCAVSVLTALLMIVSAVFSKRLNPNTEVSK